ncbi:hypothetical protein MKW92_026393 [Papaver armeniacum]|nr:hypothetical protein MKW92_026393 [Papaver armeniacum]
MVNIIGADRFEEYYNQFESGYFTLKVIKAATQNFNKANVTQRGRFGSSIYQGVLPNGMSIIVKKFSTDIEMEKVVFHNEMDATLPLRHQFIIRLLGHYSDKHCLLLVYEHMENGDLHRALFGDVTLKNRLSWKTRVKICLGIAKGLAFLHHKNQSKSIIIHRYIEPANILLDKCLNPKISGFCGARLCEGEDTHYTTEVIGTYGYLDPEYLVQGTINDKTDVYSFGVLILVLMSGKKVKNQHTEKKVLNPSTLRYL